MVILVTMVMASAVVFNITDYMNQARYARAKGEMSQLAEAITRYHYDMQAYPASLAALKNTSPYGDGSQWIPTALFPTVDPWGSACAAGTAYCYTTNGAIFSIWTLGANKTQESGAGDDFIIRGK